MNLDLGYDMVIDDEQHRLTTLEQFAATINHPHHAYALPIVMRLLTHLYSLRNELMVIKPRGFTLADLAIVIAITKAYAGDELECRV